MGLGYEQCRYGSTLSAKGAGNLVRKGTGGRSSVRASAVFLGIYEPTKQKLLKAFPENLSAFAHLGRRG
ncbi:hypothetical protein J5N97_007875 [Dioscorea zingiberensis]|uniref:Uncharacterized protein n=1 Tax=Dioscorea zingiberensis TaxID=325984 RepID=A0A9D5DDB3_9LILI|nr:hypothetical protein J5N97_007875 [Dioscorea zingiberensis]